MKIINWEQVFMYTVAVKRVEFFGDRLSYIVLRGRWLHIIVVNVHAPSEEKSEELKDSFYEELEEVFDHFPKYHMKVLLRDFNAKVGREDILKPIIGQESLYQDSNDNGVRIETLPHRKIWLLRARCSLTGTFIKTPGPPLMVRLTTRLTT